MTTVQLVHPLEVAPCGACGELVLREGGCAHWKPEQTPGQAIAARRKRERKGSDRAASRREQTEAFRAELKRAGYFR